MKEAGRSWNELRFLAADRSGKNSYTTYTPNRNNGLLLLLLLFSLQVSAVCLCSLGSSINVDVFFEEWGWKGGGTKGPTPKAKLCSSALYCTTIPISINSFFF
jgi:hypothetical protein